MPATITLRFTLGDDAIEALRQGRSITISLESPRAVSRPRVPSWAERLASWASTRGPFRTADVMRELGRSRAHASMLLSVASRRGAIRRVGRGVYIHGG